MKYILSPAYLQPDPWANPYCKSFFNIFCCLRGKYERYILSLNYLHHSPPRGRLVNPRLGLRCSQPHVLQRGDLQILQVLSQLVPRTEISISALLLIWVGWVVLCLWDYFLEVVVYLHILLDYQSVCNGAFSGMCTDCEVRFVVSHTPDNWTRIPKTLILHVSCSLVPNVILVGNGRQFAALILETWSPLPKIW